MDALAGDIIPTKYPPLSKDSNVAFKLTLRPFTVKLPKDGDTTYDETEPILYEYIPLGSVNVMLFVVDDTMLPFRVIFHAVPRGNPVSVNVMVKVARLKVIDSDKEAPLMLNDPEFCFKAYPLFVVDIE